MRVNNPRNASLSPIWICKSCQAQASQVIRRIRSLQTRSSSTATRKARLPESPTRTRFAPSPTGNLHLGSIRTALFNYLIARRTGGQFLLRVEDTDQKRTIPGAEDRLYQDLQWAGLHWDEGPNIGGPYGPYKQSQRTSMYHQHIHTLLDNKTAYRCFCSAERIDGLNRLRHEKGLPLGYDRKCANIGKEEAEDRAHRGEANVIRFHVPKEYPKFNDIVYGKTGHGVDKSKKLQLEDPVYDDPILIKSDGFPTYHFANVVDDQLMKVTHVIRGSEWMSSTPLHVALYQAFGWSPPVFGHVPLLVDHNKQKLSKRNFDSDIASFRSSGYLPEAITNFAALLGWSHQEKNDVLSLRELEDIFDLKFTKGNTIVSFDKLKYLQEQHARKRVNASGEDFEQMIRDVALALLEKHGAAQVMHFIGKRKLRNVVASMLKAESIPFWSPSDFAERVSMFLQHPQDMPQFEVDDVASYPALRVAAATLCLVPEQQWTRDVHRANIAMLDLTTTTDDLKTKKETKKNLYHYLRWALLRGVPGPSIPETMEILGREICETRVRKAAHVTRETEIMATKPKIQTELKDSQFAMSA